MLLVCLEPLFAQPAIDFYQQVLLKISNFLAFPLRNFRIHTRIGLFHGSNNALSEECEQYLIFLLQN
jgi:hypothetical protein